MKIECLQTKWNAALFGAEKEEIESDKNKKLEEGLWGTHCKKAKRIGPSDQKE